MIILKTEGVTANAIFRDQLGNEIEIPFPPKRIICLVPSITEYLIALGASVIGRTKFCVHPEIAVKDIVVVGGTKQFRFDVIDELKPDLIIGNKEENYQTGIDQLKQKYPVWLSDIVTLQDSEEMMLRVGQLVNRKKESVTITKSVNGVLNQMRDIGKGRRVLYLIWRKPWMAVGRLTYIHSMLEWMGYQNIIGEERYPELTEDNLRSLNPDIVMLSSEPFPFEKKHLDELTSILPNSEIELVNGELYSWYGIRLQKLSTIIIPVDR